MSWTDYSTHIECLVLTQLTHLSDLMAPVVYNLNRSHSGKQLEIQNDPEANVAGSGEMQSSEYFEIIKFKC